MASPDRHWSLQDTLAIRRITSTDVSPDGRRLVFTAERAVMTPGKSGYLAQIYLAEPDGKPPRQLTTGEASSFAPQWSPDGRSIAFLSQGNIWLMSLPSESTQQVTGAPAGVSTFKWSPDGRMIAFTAADKAPPEETGDIQERSDVRIVGQGTKNRRLYLVSLAALSSEPLCGKPLTGSDLNIGAPGAAGAYAWSPDGTRIVFSHCRSPSPNDMPTTRTACLDLKDGSIRTLGPKGAVVFDPSISPDGCWVACKIYDHPVWEWSSVAHLLPIDGGPARPLADTHDRRPDLLGWSTDGQWIYYLETCGTRGRLCALPVDGSPPIVLFEPQGVIENASLKSGRALGFTLQTTAQPVEAYITSLEHIAPVQVSHLNTALRQIPIGRTEVIHWRSVDGQEIEGLLTYPVGYRTGRRYPLLVSVHGGPASAWMQSFIGMQTFYGPIATFASRGYAILRCNGRGSTGYGKAFRRANYRDWAGKDVQDLLTGVDRVVDLGVADPERLGITGWSSGGYLTAATITQTERFGAAAIGAGMTDLVSYALGNDSPDYLPTHFGGEVWEVADLLLARSPIGHADQVTTPTLFLHGEHDQRVPIWQSYELYHALERRGIPTQMAVYPRTGHVPAEPVVLLDVMERILAWIETYVGGKR